jgi:hypothetical protein
VLNGIQSPAGQTPGTPDSGSVKSPAAPSTAETHSLAPLPWPPETAKLSWLADRLIDEAEPGDEAMLAWACEVADVLEQADRQVLN